MTDRGLYFCPLGREREGAGDFFFNLSPKSVEAIIDVTDAEFAIPGG